MATDSQPVQLTDIAGSLLRRWPVVLLTTLVGAGLGVGASYAIPPTYDATTTVSVNPLNGDPLTATVDAAKGVSMATEAGIVRSTKVADEAAKVLAPTYATSAKDVQDSTTVDSPDDSLILSIHYSGDSAEEAAAGADAVAEAYLLSRRSDATAQVERLQTSAREQIDTIKSKASRRANRSALTQQSLRIQANALSTRLAQLGSFDVDPGQVVGEAEVPASPSTPGPVPLGVAGGFLGLLLGIPLALLRRKEDDTEIGGVDRLHALGDPIVLDGTKDAHRADTWDLAAFMLKIPTELGTDRPFLIMVDAEQETARGTTPGQELVDALSRRGRAARFVDAGAINEGKISRGWPTDKKRDSWAGEIVVIDTTHLTSDANKVALATRSDSVLLARATNDDAASLRRLAGLLRSKGVDIALTALFPARTDVLALHHHR